jgi:hypothetical protein
MGGWMAFWMSLEGSHNFHGHYGLIGDDINQRLDETQFTTKQNWCCILFLFFLFHKRHRFKKDTFLFHFYLGIGLKKF